MRKVQMMQMMGKDYREHLNHATRKMSRRSQTTKANKPRSRPAVRERGGPEEEEPGGLAQPEAAVPTPLPGSAGSTTVSQSILSLLPGVPQPPWPLPGKRLLAPVNPFNCHFLASRRRLWQNLLHSKRMAASHLSPAQTSQLVSFEGPVFHANEPYGNFVLPVLPSRKSIRHPFTPFMTIFCCPLSLGFRRGRGRPAAWESR